MLRTVLGWKVPTRPTTMGIMSKSRCHLPEARIVWAKGSYLRRISSYTTSAFGSDEYLNSVIWRVGVPLKEMSLVKDPVGLECHRQYESCRVCRLAVGMR